MYGDGGADYEIHFGTIPDTLETRCFTPHQDFNITHVYNVTGNFTATLIAYDAVR